MASRWSDRSLPERRSSPAQPLAVAPSLPLFTWAADRCGFVPQVVRTNLGGTAVGIMMRLHKTRLWLLLRLLAEDPYKQVRQNVRMRQGRLVQQLTQWTTAVVRLVVSLSPAAPNASSKGIPNTAAISQTPWSRCSYGCPYILSFALPRPCLLYRNQYSILRIPLATSSPQKLNPPHTSLGQLQLSPEPVRIPGSKICVPNQPHAALPSPQAVRFLPSMQGDLGSLVEAHVAEGDDEATWTTCGCAFYSVLAEEGATELLPEFCCQFSMQWLEVRNKKGGLRKGLAEGEEGGDVRSKGWFRKENWSGGVPRSAVWCSGNEATSPNLSAAPAGICAVRRAGGAGGEPWFRRRAVRCAHQPARAPAGGHPG